MGDFIIEQNDRLSSASKPLIGVVKGGGGGGSDGAY
jgi:hypothetical protein